jgi:dihydrofolate reductase
VTGGPAAALERARRAADGRNVVVSGGGGTARQYLADARARPWIWGRPAPEHRSYRRRFIYTL